MVFGTFYSRCSYCGNPIECTDCIEFERWDCKKVYDFAKELGTVYYPNEYQEDIRDGWVSGFMAGYEEGKKTRE